MKDKALIQVAYFDNIRDHQIGGQTDGISEIAAENLGFSSREQTLKIIRELKPEKAKAVITASEIICGECAEVVPCGEHTRLNPRTGRIETVGY